MSGVHVYLENGFEHDRVTVRAEGVEGVEIEEHDVTTRYQIGLASVVELAVPAGAQTVTVTLPDRGLTVSTTVDPESKPHLRVNLRGESLEAEPEAAPPMFA